jgi:Cu/Ag efflux protein CusF
MRRLLLSALIAAGLMSLGGVSSFATIQQPTKQVAAISSEITGKVTDIKSDTLRIEDEAGKTHSFKVTDSKMLEGLKIGDMVKVAAEKGEATSIQKVEEGAPAGGSPEGAPAR